MEARGFHSGWYKNDDEKKMKVLMVASGTSDLGINSFVKEQADALKKYGIETDLFPIKEKGIKGYLKYAMKLRRFVKEKHYDVVHAHFIWAGVVALFQRSSPSVISFIGCDINRPNFRRTAKLLTFKRAKRLIFVSKKLMELAGNPENGRMIQYGVDLDKFFPVDKLEARKQLGWEADKKYIFFASRFDRPEKNPELAFEAVKLLEAEGNSFQLIEFKGIPAEKLNYYFNATDVFLLTSIREGSPQSVKEAMAANTPVVSTDVGDVQDVVAGIEGNYVTGFSAREVADAILKASQVSGGRTQGRKRLQDIGYDMESLTKKLVAVYKEIEQERSPF